MISIMWVTLILFCSPPMQCIFSCSLYSVYTPTQFNIEEDMRLLSPMGERKSDLPKKLSLTAFSRGYVQQWWLIVVGGLGYSRAIRRFRSDESSRVREEIKSEDTNKQNRQISIR